MYDLVSDELKPKAKAMGFTQFLSEKNLKIRKGGTLEQNRKVVRSHSQVLLNPCSVQKSFDTAVSQIAKDHDIAIAFSVSSLLEERALNKVRLLKNMKEAMMICLKMKNDIILCSNAEDEWKLKDPQCLIGFGVLLGMTRAQAKWAINQVYEGLL